MLALVLSASPAASSAERASSSAVPATTAAPASIAVPQTTTAPADPSEDSYSDPSRALGATSPTCRYALSGPARKSCEASGTIQSPHPLGHYGLDVRIGFSITDPGRSFISALQMVGAGLWMALLYVLKGVLLLLECSFSLDLTNKAMPQVHQHLTALHERVFGDWWLLLAISLTGLWGIYRGLIQRRTVETLTGLAATVALIVGGLVLISDPEGTVGWTASTTDGAGMEILAAGTGGSTTNPRDALASAMSGVFDTTVRRPWCALEFGSLDYCDKPTGDAKLPTNGEVWLAYPAQSWQRGRLHKLVENGGGGGGGVVAGILHNNPLVDSNPLGQLAQATGGLFGVNDDKKLPDDVEHLVHKEPQRTALQDSGGTFPRLALLVLVAVGLSGAIALYAYIGLRLLLAAGSALVTLLVAPPMVIAPALGDRGRAAFVAWVTRLLGSVVAKFVYATFLTVVLVAQAVFTEIALGWFGTWLMQTAFWWGIFVKRHDILTFVAAGLPRQHGDGIGHLLSHGYYAWMLGRGARHLATTAAAPATAGAAAIRGGRQERQAARVSASRELARDHLGDQHRAELVAGQAQARDVVTRRDGLQRELRATDRRLASFDENTVSANARRAKPPKPNREQEALLRHRTQLRGLLADPAAAQAEQIVRHADRNRALTGETVTKKDLEVHRARRAEQLKSDTSPATQRERELLAAATGASTGGAAELRAERWFPGEQLEARRGEELARIRAERRQRRSGRRRERA